MLPEYWVVRQDGDTLHVLEHADTEQGAHDASDRLTAEHPGAVILVMRCVSVDVEVLPVSSAVTHTLGAPGGER